MNVKKMAFEDLRSARIELEASLKIYSDALKRFPLTSPLGRLSLQANIKRVQKKIDEIDQEMKERKPS